MVPFMILEVAAMSGDLQLVELLLDSGASASICFAVHLSALKGEAERKDNYCCYIFFALSAITATRRQHCSGAY